MLSRLESVPEYRIPASRGLRVVNHEHLGTRYTPVRAVLWMLALVLLVMGGCSSPTYKPMEGRVETPTFNPDSRLGFPESLTLGIVPQQPVATIHKNWGPLADYLSHLLGRKILVKTASSIPEFEKRVAQGYYDLAYMNPYHYVVFSKQTGYKAFAKQKDKRIRGIVVTRKDSPLLGLSDCTGLQAAFPAPAAFAATLLTRAGLKELGVPVHVSYVKSHDSVYAGVAQGLHSIGGGVMRTFASLSPSIRNQLRVLWTSPGFTPHAFAYHSRLPEHIVSTLMQVVATIERSPHRQDVFESLKFAGLSTAVDSEWNDVRSLNLTELDDVFSKGR